jgi:hypothetical protein
LQFDDYLWEIILKKSSRNRKWIGLTWLRIGASEGVL